MKSLFAAGALATLCASTVAAQDAQVPEFANITFWLTVQATGNIELILERGIDVTCTLDTDNPSEDLVLTRTAQKAVRDLEPLPEGGYYNDIHVSFNLTIEDFPIRKYLDARDGDIQWLCTAHQAGKPDASHHNAVRDADGIYATLATREAVWPATSGTCDYAVGALTEENVLAGYDTDTDIHLLRPCVK